MQLAFNIEVRENKEYLLSEEDSKKAMDKAFELVKKKTDYPMNDTSFSFYLLYAIQLLLDSGEIEGILFNDDEVEEELTSVWKQIE